jgi:hypothetical protein
MNTPEAKAQYKLRGQTVELVFGDAKGNRGHDRFHGRGLSRARTETGLLTLTKPSAVGQTATEPTKCRKTLRLETARPPSLSCLDISSALALGIQ